MLIKINRGLLASDHSPEMVMKRSIAFLKGWPLGVALLSDYYFLEEYFDVM